MFDLRPWRFLKFKDDALESAFAQAHHSAVPTRNGLVHLGTSLLILITKPMFTSWGDVPISTAPLCFHPKTSSTIVILGLMGVFAFISMVCFLRAQASQLLWDHATSSVRACFRASALTSHYTPPRHRRRSSPDTGYLKRSNTQVTRRLSERPPHMYKLISEADFDEFDDIIREKWRFQFRVVGTPFDRIWLKNLIAHFLVIPSAYAAGSLMICGFVCITSGCHPDVRMMSQAQALFLQFLLLLTFLISSSLEIS